MGLGECFIQLFVAMDIIGAIPIYIALTEKLDVRRRRKLLLTSVLSALAFATLFILLGKGVFVFLGISVNDFKIAGGIILVLLALDMVLQGEPRYQAAEHVGIVPLGVPLLVGPAVITTLLIQMDTYPVHYVVLGLVTNLILVFITFRYSRKIAGMLGKNGLAAAAKIIGLFLVAIGVMMIRVGIKSAFEIGG